MRSGVAKEDDDGVGKFRVTLANFGKTLICKVSGRIDGRKLRWPSVCGGWSSARDGLFVSRPGSSCSDAIAGNDYLESQVAQNNIPLYQR